MKREGEAKARSLAPTLPPGWATAEFLEVAEITGGVTKNAAKTGGSVYPYLRVANVYANCLKLDDIASIRVTSEELHRVLLAKDDLLIVEGNGSIDQIGRVALWDGSVNPCVHQNHLIKARCLDRGLPEWLLYYLMSPGGRAAIVRAASSTSGLHTLSLSKVASLSLPIAPARTREAAVEALDSYLTRLDAVVEGLVRVESNLKRYRASVLKAAVEGRLVPTEAELAKREGRTYEPASDLLARILKERRRRWEQAELAKMKAKGESPKTDAWKSKYQEPSAPDPTNLPPLPEGWCWATVEQLAADEDYSLAIGPFGSNLKVSDYADKGTPLIFVRNIRAERFSGLDDKYISASKADELKAHQVSGGDLLITKMGDPPGDAALYPADAPDAVITADCIKVRTSPALNAEFILWMIRSAEVQAAIHSITKGVAQKKVSLGRFTGVAIPVAPVAEQNGIVGEISLRQSQAAHLASTVTGINARVSRLRQSILTWAFEGKLVDQDPNDEPASVLLDRIRAQREAGVSSGKAVRPPKKKAR